MEDWDITSVLEALSQPSRLRVFRRLVVAGEAGLTPGVLATVLGVPGPTLSFHLKALLHAGLVAQSRRGLHRIYRSDYARMRSLIDYLTVNCCAGASCELDSDVIKACRRVA